MSLKRNLLTIINTGSNDPTLENYFLGAVKLTKHPNIGQYKYFGYGVQFDRHGSYSHPSGGTGRSAIIFGVDISL